jgi:enterochelin esterase family protein
MDPILTPRLRQLQQTLQNNNTAALAEFWAEMAHQTTPLIEPTGEGDYWVTFLWQDDESSQSVAVIQDWGADQIREHQMSRLPRTDVWYKTRRFPADTRTTYQLSPSPSADPDTPAPYRTDPLNPKTHIAYLAEPGGNDIVFSLLELPEAPALPWQAPPAWPTGQVQLHTPAGDGRQVWVYTPAGAGAGPLPLLVVFDGRLYKDQLRLPAILDYLIAKRRLPPPVALLLDNSARWQELTCHPDFAAYVAGKILPWVRANYPVTSEAARTAVLGSSLGGLFAAYLGLSYPDLFQIVLSQTGWFRWRPDGDPEFEWLTRQFAAAPRLPLRFYLDVGILENARMLDDGPTQLQANRHMRDVLRAKGYPLDYVEYSGGHDFSSLEHPLAEALVKMIGS